MNGAPWPAGGGPVSLTRLVTALRKSLVRTGRVAELDPTHEYIGAGWQGSGKFLFSGVARMSLVRNAWRAQRWSLRLRVGG